MLSPSIPVRRHARRHAVFTDLIFSPVSVPNTNALGPNSRPAGQAQQIQCVRLHAKHRIEKRIDRIDTQDDQAQDHLFELELTGRLAKWPGLEIELAEPDILIRYPADHPPMALACKRPR